MLLLLKLYRGLALTLSTNPCLQNFGLSNPLAYITWLDFLPTQTLTGGLNGVLQKTGFILNCAICFLVFISR